MAFNKDDIETILNEIIEFSLPIYYLFKSKRLSIDDIKNIFLKQDIDNAILSYQKVISLISCSDIALANNQFGREVTKINCIDRVIDGVEHLKGIKDVALNLELADDIISDATYINFLNITYMSKLLEAIILEANSPRVNKIIAEYKYVLEKLEKINDKAISSDINNYYLKKVGV